MSGIAAVKPEALGEEDDAYAAYGHRPSPVQPPPQRQPTKSAQPDAGQPPGLGVLGSPVKVEVGADSGHSSPTQHSGGAESAVATQHRGIGGGDRCLVGAAAGCKDDGDDDFSSSDCLSGEDDGDCEEPIDDDFGELTSLAWLLNANLLRKSGSSGDSRGRRRGHQAGQSTSHDGGSGGCCSASVAEAPTFRQWAAPECGGVDRKPPYSFSCLIFMAIEESPGRRLPVKDVYDWISRNFPYYQSAPTGWKNSVRHNLSLNKCFRKIEHGEYRSSGGKGAQWCIEPAYRPKLLQALRRSPQYQRHQTHAETLTDSLGRLTKRLLGEASAIDEKAPRVDIDAANALVSLRHVPPSKREVSPDSAAQVSVVDSRPLSPSSCSRDAVLDGEHGGRKRKLCSEPSATVAAGGSSSSKAPAVLTDVPSLDHTYVVSTASPAAECLRAQRPSMADDDHVGFHHRDDVASRGNSEEASSSDGEPSAAVPSPPPAPAPASAAPPCRQAGPQRVERNRRVLQAYGRATLAVASRSSSRRRRLKAADVAGDASSRSLLSLASAASLAMMDAGLGRPVA